VHRALTEQMLNLGPEHYRDTQERARSLVHGILLLRADEVGVREPRTAGWLWVDTAESAVHTAWLEDPAMLEDPIFEAELLEVVCRYLGP